MNGVHDAERLKELQSLPLSRKVQITQTRIIEWYQHYDGKVCISFSGGKDSTVLMHIARQIYPDIPAVFSNTGLEYPEIQRFVKSFDSVDIVTPSMRFDEVISTYGYPLIGKEVAEAIYYARRLSLQTVKVERERESSGTKTSWGNEPQTRRVAGKQTEWKRMEICGGRRATSSRQAQRETDEQFSKAVGAMAINPPQRTHGNQERSSLPRGQGRVGVAEEPG